MDIHNLYYVWVPIAFNLESWWGSLAIYHFRISSHALSTPRLLTADTSNRFPPSHSNVTRVCSEMSGSGFKLESGESLPPYKTCSLWVRSEKQKWCKQALNKDCSPLQVFVHSLSELVDTLLSSVLANLVLELENFQAKLRSPTLSVTTPLPAAQTITWFYLWGRKLCNVNPWDVIGTPWKP